MIKYEENEDYFYVFPVSIPIKFSWLRNALITLGFFDYSHQLDLLLISNSFSSFLVNNVIGRIKEFGCNTLTH